MDAEEKADLGIGEREHLLSTVVTNAPVMVWVLDRKGRVTFLEGEVLRRLGLSKDEVLGQPCEQVFPTMPEFVEQARRALEGEASTRILEREGVVLDVRHTPVRDQNGHVAGVTGIAIDITEFKATESALISQKQLFENLVAIARATSERPTLDATLQNALEVAARLTGAELGSLFLLNEKEEVVRSILALGKAEVRHKTQIVNRVMQSGLAGWVLRNRESVLIVDTTQDERWFVRPGDRYKPRSALSVPILNGSMVIGVLTLTHPQPNQFREEHLNLIQAAADQMALALRNAQMFDEQRRMAELQQTLYRVLRTIGGQLEPDSVAQTAVDEIVRLTGWQSVSILLPDAGGKNLVVQAEAGEFGVGRSWTLSCDAGIVGRAYRSGETQHVAEVKKDPDYLQAHAQISSELALPLRRGDYILGVLNVESVEEGAFSATDIQLAESLADAVSLALENARLFQESRRTTDRLRELDRLKSSFLANMSHELRTPLNAILGYSELLEEDARDLGVEDFVIDLEKIQRAGKHLLAVINDILDFSKIEAGRMDLFLETFDVSALVDDVVTTIQPVVEKNQNRLVVECQADLGSMKADPTKVRSILINLLSNATKFTEKGTIELRAEKRREDGQAFVTFVVSDTGIGISPRQLETLFQPFIQGDISTTRKYGGTGLGLAITRGFCQMMGGDIRVTSKLGEGSTFTARIPVEVREPLGQPEVN